MVIPFKETPKFLFTTNFAFRYNKNDSSTNRRFNEYKLTNYWSYERQPQVYLANHSGMIGIKTNGKSFLSL